MGNPAERAQQKQEQEREHLVQSLVRALEEMGIEVDGEDLIKDLVSFDSFVGPIVRDNEVHFELSRVNVRILKKGEVIEFHAKSTRGRITDNFEIEGIRGFKKIEFFINPGRKGARCIFESGLSIEISGSQIAVSEQKDKMEGIDAALSTDENRGNV